VPRFFGPTSLDLSPSSPGYPTPFIFAQDVITDDDEPSEALLLHPNDWTEGSEYVREYQENDKRTFHKPGDRDCVAIDRNQWMD
jgi:hypothetical protein